MSINVPAFIEDYVNVMPAISGRTDKQVKNAAQLLSIHLRTCSNLIAVLRFFDKELATYAAKAKNYEQHKEAVTYLQGIVSDGIRRWEEDKGELPFLEA